MERDLKNAACKCFVLVELVGIEPTTSSLRTMLSQSFRQRYQSLGRLERRSIGTELERNSTAELRCLPHRSLN